MKAKKIRAYHIGNTADGLPNSDSIQEKQLLMSRKRRLALEFKERREKGISIARYDITTKRAYLEYPDGRKVYIDET